MHLPPRVLLLEPVLDEIAQASNPTLGKLRVLTFTGVV